MHTWTDFFEKMDSLSLRANQREALIKGLEESKDALKRKDEKYFARCLPTRENWRAYDEFKDDSVFLDIETTGLDPSDSEVTLVGLYDGKKVQSFVRGDNVGEFFTSMRRYKVIVTYNGTRFDLPFLLESFPGLRFDQIHIDLRYPLRRLGFVGGLKAIEKRLGIKRTERTRDLTGFDAVRLWRAYEQGDEGALDILLEYNAEDVRDLEHLMVLVYRTLKTIYLSHGFTSGNQWRERLDLDVP